MRTARFRAGQGEGWRWYAASGSQKRSLALFACAGQVAGKLVPK